MSAQITGKDYTTPTTFHPLTTEPAVPTADEIDTLCNSVDSAQRMVKAAQATADEIESRLIYLVTTFGTMPPEATASRVLAGRHNKATVTTGATKTLNEPAIAAFRDFLDSKGYPAMFEKFFSAETKHSLVNGARDVLSTMRLPKPIEEKLYQLFGRTIDVKTRKPSLKVSVITPEKPARTPRKKAA